MSLSITQAFLGVARTDLVNIYRLPGGSEEVVDGDQAGYDRDHRVENIGDSEG